MPSTDRDLIAEGRERLTALADSLTTDRAMDLALWAGQHLPILLAELQAQRERVNELAAQRNPDDEVLVEGSWFHPDDLPKILGNFMRSSDEYAREWKGARIELDKARARIAELERTVEAQLSEISDKGAAITVLRERVRDKAARIAELEDWQGDTLARISRLMTVDRTIRFRRDIPQDGDLAKALDAVLDERDRLREAEQRPPLGYVAGYQEKGKWFIHHLGELETTEEVDASIEELGPDAKYHALALFEREVQP